MVPAGAQVGLGVRTAAIYRINEQGTLQQTSNSLDMAIQGNGYFPVTPPVRRHGLHPGRHIRPVAGWHDRHSGRVSDRRRHHGPVQRHDRHDQHDRRRAGQHRGQAAPQTVGQIQLTTFPNETGLDAQGDNLFLQSGASGNPVTGNPGAPGFGSVLQGFVESSNVNVVTEISNLITAQRAYEMNSRVITTSDQMLSTLTNLRSRARCGCFLWALLAVFAVPAAAASLRGWAPHCRTRRSGCRDLFDGRAERPRAIGPSPEPGGRIVVEAAQLGAIARAVQRGLAAPPTAASASSWNAQAGPSRVRTR